MKNVFERNSLWKLKGSSKIADGRYRILATWSDVNMVCLFPLVDINKISRPFLAYQNELTELDNRQIENITDFIYPSYMSPAIEDSDNPDVLEGKKRFLEIKDLVDDELFLWNYSSQKRSRIVTTYAKQNNYNFHTICRHLNRYWFFGQTEFALIPAFSHCGAKDRIRQDTENKRGKPIVSKTGLYKYSQGKNVGEKERTVFRKYLNKYYMVQNPRPLTEIYSILIIEEFDKHGTLESEQPSIHQFRYWVKKLFKSHDTFLKQTSPSEYARNYRPVIKSATHRSTMPGSAFEIDATVADVHIVSAFQKNHAIGRPTIYFIVDRASRIIVGMHVSLLYASWNAARNAIVNAGMPKVEYAARFGVDINESDWPCAHLPQLLLVDRGEMVGIQPEKHVVPLMDLKIAPPYRAEMKTMVERRFGLVNDAVIHRLPGTTRGKMLNRGLPDPKTKATYTLDNFTKVIIEAVIALNHKQYEHLATINTTLLEKDLSPTPVNYWNAHIENGRNALRRIDPTQLRALLLPEITVSVTEMGLKYEEMYYSCEKAEKENWFSIARKKKRWRLKARAHDDDTSFIFIFDTESDSYLTCYLLDRSSITFKSKSISDIYYFQDWRKSKTHKKSVNKYEVSAHISKLNMDKLAKEEQKSAPKLKTKSEKTNNTKARRRDEITKTFEAETSKPSEYLEGNSLARSDEKVHLSREEKTIALLKSIND